MLSIPRDLYVPIAGTDGSQQDQRRLQRWPQRPGRHGHPELGIPIDRYMEVDFVSFAGLVDGLGGITIDFPNPAFRTPSPGSTSWSRARSSSTASRPSPTSARATTRSSRTASGRRTPPPTSAASSASRSS